MATAANTASINSSENWQRINLIGELCIKESLLDILHNRNNDPSYCGLPQTALQLYQRMLAFKTAHEKALRRIIRPNQWDVICPSSGNCNSRDWDITIIKVIIQYENLIPPPIGGWEISSPCILDITKAAHVCRAKDIRNELKHGTIKDMCDVNKYNNLISRIEVALLGMNYSNMALFYELKHCSLQVYTPQTVQILQQRLSDVRDELANLKIDNNDIRNNLAADFSHISDTIQQNYDDVIELVNKSISDLSSENQNLLTEQINKFSDVYQFVENHRMKIEEDIVVITNRLDELQNQASSISQENDQNKKRIDENEIRNQAKFNQHDKELKNLKEEGKKNHKIADFGDWVKVAENLANALGTSGNGQLDRGNGCKVNWSFKGQLMGFKWKYIGVCVDESTGISKTSIRLSRRGAIEHCLDDLFQELGALGKL